MPARMWKHGIHSFLELLRRRLPESIDYMLAFIYLAYDMMARLYETVPAFEDTWIECLGDLARYRMAIDDEDVRDRETWAGVARSWYSKAADKNPTVGRLYHHLAILARPNALQQLYYYARSLGCMKPYQSTRESVLTLLDPVLRRQTGASSDHALPIDTSFIQAHTVLSGELTPGDRRDPGSDSELPKEHGDRVPQILDFLCRTNNVFARASALTRSTFDIVLRRIGDKNVLTHFHVRLAFTSSSTSPLINLVKSFLVRPSIISLMSGLSMLPTAIALPLPTRQPPLVEENKATYSDDSIGDWIISVAVLVYLAIAYCLDQKTRKLSLAGSITSAIFWVAMVSEGDRPEFPSNYRWNILKTWAATTIALTCQAIKSSTETVNRGIPAPPNASCSESITHRFLFQLFAISALIQVTGMAIQSFGKSSFLNALPPCFSIAVLITSRLNQRVTQHRRIAIDPAPSDSVSVDSPSTSNQARPSPRGSANASLPHPSHFEDDVDLYSVAESQTGNTHPRP